MPGTSQQQLCCILEVCCRGAQRSAALAKLLAAWQEEADDTDSSTLEDYLAAKLLATFDLVPKGLGTAIVDGYAPLFETYYKP